MNAAVNAALLEITQAQTDLEALEREHPRSPKWPAVERAHLEKEGACVVCGKSGKGAELNVHHVKPYHLFPDLELEPANLVTVCNASLHHLWFGHLGDFRTGYNLDVRKDAKRFLQKMQDRESGG